MAKPTIVTRAGKGSALTWTEGDANLTNLKDATVTIVAGTGGTSVVSDLNGSVTLVAGTNVTITGDNTAKTVTINSSGGGGGLANVVEDTTPQLGGALDTNGYSITSASNANVTIAPNGTGDIALNTDNGQVTIGNGSFIFETSSLVAGGFNVGGGLTSDSPSGINLQAGTNGINLSTITGNAAIRLEPHGTGDVYLTADTTFVGDLNSAATVTTNGTGNLTLSTNNGTNASTMVFSQGANGNITVTPNGTGAFVVSGPNVGVRTNNTGGSVIGRVNTTTSGTYLYPGLMAQKNRTDILTAAMTNEPAIVGFSVRDSALVTTQFGRLACTYQGTGTNPFFRFQVSPDAFTTTVDAAIFGGGVAQWGNSSGSYTHTTPGTGNMTLSTNQGTNSGTIVINSGVNGNIAITPNGTGAVDFGATRPGSKIQYRRTYGCFHKMADITAAAADTV
jgi:hypothetical protein